MHSHLAALHAVSLCTVSRLQYFFCAILQMHVCILLPHCICHYPISDILLFGSFVHYNQIYGFGLFHTETEHFQQNSISFSCAHIFKVIRAWHFFFILYHVYMLNVWFCIYQNFFKNNYFLCLEFPSHFSGNGYSQHWSEKQVWNELMSERPQFSVIVPNTEYIYIYMLYIYI